MPKYNISFVLDTQRDDIRGIADSLALNMSVWANRPKSRDIKVERIADPAVWLPVSESGCIDHSHAYRSEQECMRGIHSRYLEGHVPMKFTA